MAVAVVEGQEGVGKMPSIVRGIGTHSHVVEATPFHRLEPQEILHH